MIVRGVTIPAAALAAGEEVMRTGALFRRAAVAEAICSAWRKAERVQDFGRSERAAEQLIDRAKKAGQIVQGPDDRRDWRWAGETSEEVAEVTMFICGRRPRRPRPMVHHATFGVGTLVEDRGDRVVADFPGGRRTVLKDRVTIEVDRG